MICNGNKSNAHLGWWSLQRYKFGDIQNVDFFVIFQVFSRALKVIKSLQPWSDSAKNRLSKAGKDWILLNYILQTTLAKVKHT